MKKGKLIVIEGGDGSGKTVQSKMLVQYLNKTGHKTEYFDFPQYNSFFGETVAMFLRGEFGKIDNISPYLASLPYALDRATTKLRMINSLNKGINIIANRYATSSLVYQTAKITNLTARNRFIRWVTKLEYEINGIPKEDLVIYLNVPWKIGLQLTKKKAPRAYLKGHEDIHEAHHIYRQKVEKLYLEFITEKKNWLKLDCTQNNRLLSISRIHHELIKLVTSYLI